MDYINLYESFYGKYFSARGRREIMQDPKKAEKLKQNPSVGLFIAMNQAEYRPMLPLFQ